MSIFAHQDFDGHEGVHFFDDDRTGLKAIIAIHNTNLGPSAGGTRFWNYASGDAALTDALRLSKAMSYKNAMAGIAFGGGKGVILRPDGEFDRRALFEAYGRAIEALGGRYYTAEDVGVSPADMEAVHTQTGYVAGLDTGAAASGDPSPLTAAGIFKGLEVAARRVMNTKSLEGLHIAVQGLGHVGYNLCQLLSKAGADLTVTDINRDAAERARRELGANIVGVDDIYDVTADIFTPCALGGAINPKTVDRLKVRIVGGGANNQLANADMGRALMTRGILYCPDYVINAGGIINVASEISGRYDKSWVLSKIDDLGLTLASIFSQSEAANTPTDQTADEMAREKIYGKK